jgi:hypothetical protein
MDITLALGGGGAKGNAHIGVLHRLEQEDINAGRRDKFCAVGILYASGIRHPI